MAWLEEERAVLNQFSTLPEEKQIEFLTKVFGNTQAFERLLIRCLKSSGDVRDELKAHTGCKSACGSAEIPSNLWKKFTEEVSCYNRRLSRIEEERLRANTGGTVDLPNVNGGAEATVVVPAYGIEYWVTQYSIDGTIALDTGNLSKVEITLEHAGWPFGTFRASQFTKDSCCTTVANCFRQRGMCFGHESTWTIKIKNLNALPGETFVNGVLSYCRAYPDPAGTKW